MNTRSGRSRSRWCHGTAFGDSIQTIAEVLGVAVAINAGAALVYSTRVNPRYRTSILTSLEGGR
jgi:hypothetical protein